MRSIGWNPESSHRFPAMVAGREGVNPDLHRMLRFSGRVSEEPHDRFHDRGDHADEAEDDGQDAEHPAPGARGKREHQTEGTEDEGRRRQQQTENRPDIEAEDCRDDRENGCDAEGSF